MGVQDSPAGMGGLYGESKLCPLAVKFSAPLNELGDPLGPLLDKHANCRLFAETGACFNSIFKVNPHFILITQCDRNAALRIFSTALGGDIFCNYKYVAVR